jgi:branched-subunit amino acid ABC-type transport system permease component
MITTALVSGLGLGSMYALLALGFHLTYAVSRTVNFAQGSAMMVGAVLGYSLAVTWGWPLWLALPTTLLLCAVLGLAIERFLVRPFHARGSDAWLMATVAGGLLLDNLAMFTFGKEPRQFGSALTSLRLDLGDSSLNAVQLAIPLAGAAVAATLYWVRGAGGPADRTAVQRARGHGHAVRSEGFRRGHSGRHRQCRWGVCRRPAVWPARGGGHAVFRLCVHAIAVLCTGDRGARGTS